MPVVGGDSGVTTGTSSRRRFLKWGLSATAVVVAGGAAGVELVAHGVLPGQHLLYVIDGACSVALPPESFDPEGSTYLGSFFSQARNTRVGYTLAYPPGHDKGSELPLVVYLHGWGGNHLSSYGGLTLARALALRSATGEHLPMAMICADGGRGYWHAHPGDDPMSMLVDELIPLCRRLGLGSSPQKIGMTGISMGGYGAILVAEKHPELVSAVAAISPAVWTTWPQAHNANPTAYTSAADFAANNVVAHTSALAGIGVRVASGVLDPFHPGVEALVHALPHGAVVDFSKGCHTGPFFAAQVPPSLGYLSRHLIS
jgi:pimeloyl-ACP methyl ester carboxylesterase